MVLFQLDPLLVASSIMLAILPFSLVLAFLTHGKEVRIQNLRSYISPDVKAREIVTSSEELNSEMKDLSLAGYLEARYRDRHTLRRYLAPLLVFHLVYLFLIYWSFIAFERFLSGKADSGEEPLWWIASIGAAGAMGAILIVLWHLFWRTMRTDLQPIAFLHSAGRLAIAPFIGIVLTALLPLEEGFELAISFVAGLFGHEALRLLESRWRDLVGLKSPAAQLLPVRCIEGVSANDELRLWEEGVTDAQHLAIETVENLLVNTPYSLECIIDWKDQALLYAYVGDEIATWRSLQNRGAMDILGMAPCYYGAERCPDLVNALAQAVKKDKAIVERFIDTIYQDPRVHQLWKYLKQAYPATIAEPLGSGEPETKEIPPGSR
ncbi:MAG TPA: hypothetical protein VF179_29975 [Thermoanaerobaculia bacterium]|nr:hypothetical protein [Thermoanaerobaculia bacterium]